MLLALGLALAGFVLTTRVSAQALPDEEAKAEAARQQALLAKMSPVELFEEADYLSRTGQPARAVPYLEAFLQREPDDETMIEIRDKLGVGAFLRLGDQPATKTYASRLVERLNEAQRRFATRPDRVQRYVDALSQSPQEQQFAVDRLRQAGPYAVPAILAELEDQRLSSAERARVAANLGRLDRSAVPALIAALDSPVGSTVASVADALGAIGDRRALPYLTIKAAQPEPDTPGRANAQRAITRITGMDYAAQPRSPLRVLTDEAWKYHRHQIGFPSDTVELWTCENRDAPVPITLSTSDAEARLGLRLAREALALEPTDLSAQVALVSLALDKAIERAGLENFPNDDPSGAYATALASGPVVLGEVLRNALADGHADLAAVAARAFGQVADRDALPYQGKNFPLVEALGHPDRRVQFAAAQTLVEMAPQRPFAGSSRVVPVLTRFLGEPSAPRAVVIDGNVLRGNRVSGALKKLGYSRQVSTSGEEGFRLASESAGVELIVLEPGALQGAWRAVDTITNLRADARTAGIPIFVLYPLDTSRYPTVAEPVRPHPDVEPNDSQELAHPVLYSGGVRQARLQGSLGTDDVKGDYFRLGDLEPGTRIAVEVELFPGSDLTLNDLAVTLEGSGDRVLAQAAMGRLGYNAPTSDTYYLRIQVPQGRRGPGAQYGLLVTLIDLMTAQLANERMLDRLRGLIQGHPRVVPLALSEDPEVLQAQIQRELERMGARPLSDAERAGYAQTAANLLAEISQRPGSPFAVDLPAAGPALASALNAPDVAPAASAALGDVPGSEAQRGLVELLLDPGQPAALRVSTANQLARSLARFGPLLSDEEEARLVEELDREPDPALRAALSQVIGALRPSSAAIGQRLRGFRLPSSGAAPSGSEVPTPETAEPNPAVPESSPPVGP
jgi:HEAT repeat protein